MSRDKIVEKAKGRIRNYAADLKNVADRDDEFAIETAHRDSRQKSPDYMMRSSNDFRQKGREFDVRSSSPPLGLID